MSVWFIYPIAFTFGVLFGNFATSFIHRIPAGKPLLGNKALKGMPPHCANCGKLLKFYEYMPIFGYILSGGKCRKCKVKIPSIYPFTELFCGILSTILVWCVGLNYLFVFTLFMIVIFYTAIIVCYIEYMVKT